jgi:hypothetical protein
MPPPPGTRARESELRELLGRIQRIEAGGADPEGARDVETGWDGRAGPTRLGRRAVHEWFGELRGGRDWRPPLALLVHLARRAWCSDDARRWTFWVGRGVWPYPQALARGHALVPAGGLLAAAPDPAPDGALFLEHAVFVDPPDDGSRLWAIDLALRCPSVAAVVADGDGFAMAATRRLQLAAEAGRALALLARAPWEVATRSAASTRWRVSARVAPGSSAPRVQVELLHAKGRALERLARREG